MKKTRLILTIGFWLLPVLLMALPFVLGAFHLTLRVWAQAAYAFVLLLCAIVFFCVIFIHFRKEPGMLMIGVIWTLACVVVAGGTAHGLKGRVETGVVTENGKMYVIQHEPTEFGGSGPFIDVQYPYVNWFLISEENTVCLTKGG
ncbi:MAG: hypothetical protein FWF49_06035 [Oscillospiraceae bacterium]|nr:hypothetical protein [Oscillospiraceae bacterium]